MLFVICAGPVDFSGGDSGSLGRETTMFHTVIFTAKEFLPFHRLCQSGMWTHQFELNYSNQWFKSKVTRVLRDQYIQQWSSEIE